MGVGDTHVEVETRTGTRTAHGTLVSNVIAITTAGTDNVQRTAGHHTGMTDDEIGVEVEAGAEVEVVIVIVIELDLLIGIEVGVIDITYLPNDPDHPSSHPGH